MRTLSRSVLILLIAALGLSSCAADPDQVPQPTTGGEATAGSAQQPDGGTASADAGQPTDGAPDGRSDNEEAGQAGSSEPAGSARSAAPTIAPAADLGRPAFPLRVADTGDHLVDADGAPFLIHGDAPWSLIVQLDPERTAGYLATRRQQGVNTLVVNLIEHENSDDPPRDEQGREPFQAPGDFSRPDDAYFDSAVRQVQQAADEGFMVLLAPAYLGFDGGQEGWYQEMLAAGPDVMRGYGRYVGQKFADADNVIWLHAGDFSPPPEGRPLVEAVEAGLRDAGATQLRTAHGSPGDSASDLGLDIPLDIDTTYTYDLTYLASREDEVDAAAGPHFLFETAYEDDGRDRTREELRAQAYGALLSGAAGQVYGHGAVWPFVTGWEDRLEDPGAQDQVRVRELFERLPWPLLEPDLDASVVVEESGSYGQDNFAVAAATADRRVVAVYVPEVRQIGLDLGQDPTGAAVQWFDPVAGTTVDASAEMTATGIRARPPGDNAGGDGDWVLLVDLNAGGPSDAPPTDPPEPTAMLRLAGSERIATSVAVSTHVLDRSPAVVLTSAADFPDALVGAPLALARGAALLQSNRASLPQVTVDEIDRLGAQRVIVLGGPSAITPDVIDALRGRGLTVERISGPDRIATAVAAARSVDQSPDLVVLVSGEDFPDALAGAALAGALGAPLLLTDGTTVSAATASLIDRAQVLVVGGPAVVAETVLEELRRQGATVIRIGGADRYETAAQVADEAVRRTHAPGTMWLATGVDFPDGLAAAAGAVRDDGVVLLTDGRAPRVPTATAQALRTFAVCEASTRLVGGTSAITAAHEAAIADLLIC